MSITTVPVDAVDDARPRGGALFAQLLCANTARIHAFILSLVHDRTASRDILQEVSVVLWKKFDSFQPGSDFGAWAIQVARLCVFEWRREQKRLPLQLDDDCFALLADEAEDLSSEFETRRTALESCIGRLPPGDQDLLMARYYRDVSVSSLAARAHRTRMAIYKRLNKIHGLLLECIQRHLLFDSGSGDDDAAR